MVVRERDENVDHRRLLCYVGGMRNFWYWFTDTDDLRWPKIALYYFLVTVALILIAAVLGGSGGNAPCPPTYSSAGWC